MPVVYDNAIINYQRAISLAILQFQHDRSNLNWTKSNWLIGFVMWWQYVKKQWCKIVETQSGQNVRMLAPAINFFLPLKAPISFVSLWKSSLQQNDFPKIFLITTSSSNTLKYLLNQSEIPNSALPAGPKQQQLFNADMPLKQILLF